MPTLLNHIAHTLVEGLLTQLPAQLLTTAIVAVVTSVLARRRHNRARRGVVRPADSEEG
ncbi:hypothetical protein [Streptomyces millisiae]|uniref:Uncharacterized protein n=1 Tax=Streptomyces millisiae TaxID=3075542 RepID=A0ABU2LK59_9ACTN|nr:hypothetical protein [Streptomyces sp. DSM 44918]MDT0317966.1 hypothetical protein [Streptomyces sp. DSM 44918]